MTDRKWRSMSAFFAVTAAIPARFGRGYEEKLTNELVKKNGKFALSVLV